MFLVTSHWNLTSKVVLMFQKTATSHSNLISWLMRSQCRIPWNRGTGFDKWKPCQGPDSEWTEIIECENAFLQNRGSLMWAAGWLEWIVHSWRTINHVLNCQFSCLSVLRLRRSGGVDESRIRKLSFVKSEFLSYTASKSAFNKGALYAVRAKHTSVDLVMKSAMAFTFTLWLWRCKNGHFTCTPMPPYMPDRGGGG